MPVKRQNLITDIAGLKVGNAQNRHIKTGVTVLTADAPFTASAHIMGGAPGTFDTALLAPDKLVSQVDALVLSGGSAFGLSACSGVMDALLEMGRGFAVGAARVPIVPGAILFDLLNGGDKAWDKNPYAELGKEALHAASETFQLGSYGAGTGALSANLKGGLGSASEISSHGWSVGALVAVNPIGAVTTPDQKHFWAAPFEHDREFGGFGVSPQSNQPALSPSLKMERMKLTSQEHANTTIAIVATDAPLDKAQCHRLSIAAHDGMARAIVPSHTPFDGDLVFGLSTNAAQTPMAADILSELGAIASSCLARAIARGVYEAHAEENDLLPCF